MVLHRWPWWAGRAAALWSAGLAVALLAGSLAGHTALAGVDRAAPAGAGVLSASAVAAQASLRPIGTDRRRRLVVAGVLWGAAAACLATSCFVLLNAIELVLTGTVTDPDGNSDWITFAQRLGLLGAAVPLGFSALSWQRRASDRCPWCGQRHGTAAVVARRHRAAVDASRRMKLAALLGCAALVPYTALHTLGAFGVPGIEPPGLQPDWRAAAALHAGVGLASTLLLALVHRWGAEFPRWTGPLAGRPVPTVLLAVPVLLVAPTLALYGTGAMVYVGLLAVGVLRWDGQIGLLGVAAPVAFGGYGWALALAAVHYLRRTRRVCVVAGPSGPIRAGSY